MAEQFVLLWSKSMNATKVEKLEDALGFNRRRYRDNEASDWIPLYVGERGTVTACAGHCCPTLMDREFEAIEKAHAPVTACQNLQAPAQMQTEV